MFTQRLITAIFFAPFILGSILWGTPNYLIGLAAVLLAIAAYEWVKLIPLPPLANFIYVPFVFVALAIALQYEYYALGVAILCWTIFFFAIITYPKSAEWWGEKTVTFGLGLIFLPVWIVSLKMIYTRAQGEFFILTLIFMIWAADVGAYLVGKAIGRNKLLPLVSPGKTWEGVIGGLIFSAAVVLACTLGFHLTQDSKYSLVFGVLLWVPVSILGDLFFSMLKRRVGLKDTGSLLPGHGGILDRFDSQICAAPFFIAYLSMWGQ